MFHEDVDGDSLLEANIQQISKDIHIGEDVHYHSNYLGGVKKTLSSSLFTERPTFGICSH